MLYQLVLMACLASVPNSMETCRTMEAEGGTATYCTEQRRMAIESLRREGYRVFAVCAPVAQQTARVK